MSRKAVTLVELLVVIAIIGVLLSLLLPAIQNVREAAHRAACGNNLRQVGIALHHHHDTHRAFPAGLTVRGSNDLELGSFGGFIPLLPFLEQENWVHRWDANRTWYEPPNDAVVGVEVKTFYCPSNRTGGVIDMSFLVAAAGRPLPNPAACDYLLCKGANAAMCEVTRVPPAGRGAFDVNTHTRLADVADGASNTFAVGEGAGSSPRYGVRHYYADTVPAGDLFPGQSDRIDQSWSCGPTATRALRSLGLLQGASVGVTAQRGGHADPFDERMNHPLGLPALEANNGCTNAGTAAGAFDTISGFRSVHPGGCHFLFCDGGVRFVRETVPPTTYRGLSTIAGGEVAAGH